MQPNLVVVNLGDWEIKDGGCEFDNCDVDDAEADLKAENDEEKEEAEENNKLMKGKAL